MASKHPAVCVQLIDHDITQVFKQLGPARMMREHSRMEHVGIAEHDVRAAADGLARVLRRVAVVCEHADLGIVTRGEQFGNFLELG